MPLHFPIGSTNNNELVVKDITSLPHLFVVYNDAAQLTT